MAWRGAAAGGAELLWRAGAQLSLPVDAVLGDGTYLSRLKAPRHLRTQGAPEITARVIEYHVQDAAGEVTETFTLITTLTSPDAAPARELAELYHARWGLEPFLRPACRQAQPAGPHRGCHVPHGRDTAGVGAA